MTWQVQGHPWLTTLVFALAAAVAAILGRHFARLTLLRLARRNPIATDLLKGTERAGAAVFPILALMLVWQNAPETLPGLASVRHFTDLGLIGAFTWFVVSAIDGLAKGVIDANPSSAEDNLHARRIQTQTSVLGRSAQVVAIIAGAAMALMTFPGARQVGASLLASAGVLGVVGGLAARPVFSNLIAGLQIALAEPIRLDDVLIVKGEWGRVEEITSTYVVLKIWDERRMVIPLQWFIENPFENWTRTGANILGYVYLWVDFGTPIDPIRAEARRITEAAPEWDKRVFGVQVTDSNEKAMQVRILVSAGNSGKAFDLRCKIREGIYAFLAREYPESLPRLRMDQREEALT